MRGVAQGFDVRTVAGTTFEDIDLGEARGRACPGAPAAARALR